MNRGSLCQLDTNGSTTSIDGSNYAELLPVEEINKSRWTKSWIFHFLTSAAGDRTEWYGVLPAGPFHSSSLSWSGFPFPF